MPKSPQILSYIIVSHCPWFCKDGERKSQNAPPVYFPPPTKYPLTMALSLCYDITCRVGDLSLISAAG